MKEIFIEVLLPIILGIMTLVVVLDIIIPFCFNLANYVQSKEKYRIVKVNYSSTFRVQYSFFGIIWRTMKITRATPGGDMYSFDIVFDTMSDAERFITKYKETPNIIKRRGFSIVKEEA